MSKRYAQAVVEAADQLGLELREDQEAFELTESLNMIRAADKAGAGALEKAGEMQEQLQQKKDLMSKMGAFLPMGQFFQGHRAAMGAYRGCRVLLLPEISDNTSRLHVVVMLPQPLSLNLHIYPEGLASRVGKLLLRLQDIQIGHAQLDPLVMIKAGDQRGATRMLTGTDVQNALLTIYQAGEGDPTCNDIACRVNLPGAVSGAQVCDWVERLADLAVVLK